MPSYPKVKLNVYHYLVILFSPFVFLLYSLRTKSVDLKFKAAFVFCIFFGVYFITTYKGLDSYRHLEYFKTFEINGFEILKKHVEDVLNRKADPELYVPVVNYILSRFSISGSLLFGFHALVYAFFYIGSIRIIYEKAKLSRNKLTLGLFLMVIFLFPIHQINTVRWFTAMWCFVYCALRYFNGEKRFLWYAFGAGLIHFSLYVAPVFMLLSVFIGYRPRILIAIAIMSFAVPRVQSSALADTESSVGIESLDNRVGSYNNASNIEQRQIGLNKTNWYVRFRYTAIFYFMIIMGVIYLWFHFKSPKAVFSEKLYTFLFLWGSFVNFTFNIPSFGGRMRFMFWVLLAMFFYVELTEKKIRFEKPLGYLALGAILLYALVDFRAYSDWVSVQVLSTPIARLFLEPLTMTVRELVFFWESYALQSGK